MGGRVEISFMIPFQRWGRGKGWGGGGGSARFTDISVSFSGFKNAQTPLPPLLYS